VNRTRRPGNQNKAAGALEGMTSVRWDTLRAKRFGKNAVISTVTSANGQG
jgi:hypothetical protein